MTLTLERKTAVNIYNIGALRYSGATLGQIAEKIGRSRERVRQILMKNYGSTGHRLLSTSKLGKLSGLSYYMIMKLYHNGIINPVLEWDTSSSHYRLWSQTAVGKIKDFNKLTLANRYCRICHRPVPEGRQCYCSEECYKESHKYRYRSLKAKQRLRYIISKYKEICKLPA